jgi:hypothetical protein
MDGKLSSAIFVGVMDAAGTPAWDKWKADRAAANLPFVDDPRQPQKPPSPSLRMKKTGAAAVLP